MSFDDVDPDEPLPLAYFLTPAAPSIVRSAFFSSQALETHAQPCPFSPGRTRKTLIRTEPSRW